MDDQRDRDARIIHTGEGPYPHPCAFCGEEIEEGEPYVLKDDGTVLHETCNYFADEEGLTPGAPRG